MNDVIHAIKNRRSIRKYSAVQISQENLELILEAGIYAPTAHNDQPWHFTVIQNPEMLKYINETVQKGMGQSDREWIRNMGANPSFQVTYGSPTLIIVSGRKDAIAGLVDCSAAIQNMLLAAESLGIGSVWLGLVRFFFEQEAEAVKLEIPEGYQPFYGVSLGYAANERKPVAPKRKTDVINYIR